MLDGGQIGSCKSENGPDLCVFFGIPRRNTRYSRKLQKSSKEGFRANEMSVKAVVNMIFGKISN